MNKLRRTLSTLLVMAAVLIAPLAGQASARPVPESEMDRSYTGPGGRGVQPVGMCQSRFLVGYSCTILRRVYTWRF